MTVQYTWSFPQFEIITSQDGLSNVVKTIHWRLSAQDDDAYFSTMCGSVALGDPDADTFIPFENITEQWAIDTVAAVVDVHALREYLAADIERQRNPPVQAVSPPWSA